MHQSLHDLLNENEQKKARELTHTTKYKLTIAEFIWHGYQ
jgi:hypothetical protein